MGPGDAIAAISRSSEPISTPPTSTLEYAAVNYQLNYTTRPLARDDLFYTELYNNTI